MQSFWLMILLAGAAGCAAHENKLPDPAKASAPAGEPAVATPGTEPLVLTKPDQIVLAFGDVLEVSYFKAYADKGVYRFEVGDTLKVSVANRSELTIDTVVLPDGRVTLPLLGPVPIGGMTIDQATADVKKRYAKHFAQPQVDLLVTRPRARLDDFFDVILKSPKGPVREITLADASLVLPLIPPIKAVGRPLSWVRKDVQTAYAKAFPEIRVSLVMLSRFAKTIAVLGEVTHGGVFEAQYPISAMRALALAGGVTDRAKLEQVLLVRPAPDGKLQVAVLDMKKALDGEDMSICATAVSPNDVLYVPKSRIANVDIFVDQYVRKMIPIPIGVAGTAF